MSVPLSKLTEHWFQIPCELVTPMHVGAGFSGGQVDSVLRRNASGKLVIPGTSLAGVLRSLCEEFADPDDVCLSHSEHFRSSMGQIDQSCKCSVCQLFGNVAPVDDQATASRLTIMDAVVTNAKTRVVDQVAMDRSRRTAADARKFDLEQLLIGARFTLNVLGKNLTKNQLEIIGAAIRQIAESEAPIGGKKNRGHGFVEAAKGDCKSFKREIHKVDALLDSIIHDAGGWKESLKSLDDFPQQPIRFVRGFSELRLRSDIGTFLINDPVQQTVTGFDHAARVLDGKFELPASSLTGVLRGSAERIVRTMGGHVCDSTETACCSNSAEENGKGHCFVCRLFGNQDWASRLSVRVVSSTASQDNWIGFDHVAIDRFTGGARDGQKFDSMPAIESVFSVEMRISHADDSFCRASVGLLMLIFNEIECGRLTIGSGCSKGHGRFRAAPPQWELPKGWQAIKTKKKGHVVACIEELENALGVK